MKGDLLASRNDGPAKAAILEGNGDYLPPAERVAVFDNDGTLQACSED